MMRIEDARKHPPGNGRRDTWILLAGLIFSIIFHLTFLLPLVVDVSQQGDRDRLIELASAIEPPALDADPEEPVLGIDESMAKTMNWIGYEDYEEHLARLSENDQAAFDTNDSAGGGAPPSTPMNRADSPPEDRPTGKPQPAPSTVRAPNPEAQKESLTPRADRAEQAATTGKNAPDKDPDAEAAEQDDAPPPQPEDSPEPSEPKPPAPEPKPGPQPGPGSGDGDPGDAPTSADKESDATSVIDVPRELWTRGRPLAAQGVELQTRRPVLDTLTQLSARFGNPLVQINFARNGRPTGARILQSSGDVRLDEPILDSLYRWRAKGKKLQELKDGGTFDVTLRILLR
ncbi:MAG: hypothetical protein CMJ33_08970 [Phycisphaerae bacterium]|nr:hypothetical protein [Phycisphaerae bacterium]